MDIISIPKYAIAVPAHTAVANKNNTLHSVYLLCSNFSLVSEIVSAIEITRFFACKK